MKSVLISIQPKWVNKIASGEKTIEVRKSRPKLETPFKCYIYCTNGTQLVDVRKETIYLQINKPFLFTNGKSNNVICSTPPQVNRKVIGEFVCDRIIDIPYTKPFLYYGKKMYHSNKCSKEACLSYIELENYLGNKDGYGWHISDLKIYDKPKELGEFRTPCKMGDYPCCGICDYAVHGMDGDLIDCDTSLTRPPQSWQFVESLGE